MTEACPKCGRPLWPAGALATPHMVHCWQSGGHECEGYAAGYTHGRRDAAARSSADAQLGAAVRAHVTRKWCEKHLGLLRATRGSLSLSSRAYERSFATEIALFEAIVPLLSEDP